MSILLRNNMTLEKVKKHNYRDDLFLNEIIQKEEEIDYKDKLIIKKIFIEEIS